MTHAEFRDHLFAQAVGILGMEPEKALSIPMIYIIMALEAKVDWVMKTNPFAYSEPKKKADVGKGLDALAKHQNAKMKVKSNAR